MARQVRQADERGMMVPMLLLAFVLGLGPFLVFTDQAFGAQVERLIFGRHSPRQVALTRRRMTTLRTALMAYKADLGRYPHIGRQPTPGTVDAANIGCLGLSREENVLYSSQVGGAFEQLGRSDYPRKWKGPYLGDEPVEAMSDAWGNKIRLETREGDFCLHSAGPDGEFALTTSDDIVVGLPGREDGILLARTLQRSRKTTPKKDPSIR